MDEQRKRSEFQGSGEVAVEGVFQAIAERVGATKFLGYEATAGKSKIVALVADGKEVDDGRTVLEECRGRHRRDAVLRRAGRPDGRHRRAGVGLREDDRARLQAPGLDAVGSRRRGAVGRAARRRRRRPRGRRRAPRRHPPQPLGDAPPPLGAAPRARHARHAEGLAGRARSPALRLLALGAADRRGEAARRGPRQRARAQERRRRHRGAADRRGASRRARSRSSARSTATACAS